MRLSQYPADRSKLLNKLRNWRDGDFWYSLMRAMSLAIACLLFRIESSC
ncbi:hypothetical protein [Microseira sp. BLCC-F43]